MQGTRHDDRTVNRPIAKHSRKPHLALTIALIEMRLTELPVTSMRRQILEQMIQRART